MSAYQTGFDVGLPTDARGSKSGGCFRKSITFTATLAALFSAIALALVVYVGFYIEDTDANGPIELRVGVATPLSGYASSRSLFAGTGSWTSKKVLPTGTSDFLAVTVGDKIYMIGGAVAAGTTIATVTEYDPVIDEYSNKTAASAGRNRYAAAVVGTKIYIIGGLAVNDWVANTGTEKTTWIYDTADDTWTVGPELTTSRSDFCAFTVGTKIYAVGGYTLKWETLDSVEVLDTSATTPAWAAAPSLPDNRGDVTCASSGGKGYAIGGFHNPTANISFDNTAFKETMYELDVIGSATAWTTKAPMPVAVGDKAAATLSDGSILVIGGETHNRSSSTQIATHTSVQYYPTHDTWVTKAPMPTARFRFGAATDADGFVHVFGGHDNEAHNTMDSHEVMMDVTHPDIWIHTKEEL